MNFFLVKHGSCSHVAWVSSLVIATFAASIFVCLADEEVTAEDGVDNLPSSNSSKQNVNEDVGSEVNETTGDGLNYIEVEESSVPSAEPVDDEGVLTTLIPTDSELTEEFSSSIPNPITFAKRSQEIQTLSVIDVPDEKKIPEPAPAPQFDLKTASRVLRQLLRKAADLEQSDPTTPKPRSSLTFTTESPAASRRRYQLERKYGTSSTTPDSSDEDVTKGPLDDVIGR